MQQDPRSNDSSRSRDPEHGADVAEDGHGVSRRAMLAGSAGAGMAAMASGAILGSGQAGASPEIDPNDDADASVSGEAVFAKVRPAGNGTIDIFAGERQVTIRDRSLAARLRKAAS